MDQHYEREHEFNPPTGSGWVGYSQAAEGQSPLTMQHPLVRAPRGHAWFAWFVIVLVCAGLLALRAFEPEATSAVAKNGDQDRLGIMLTEFQGKYFVAAAQLQGNSALLYDSAQSSLDKGTLPVRQRFIVLAAELAGAEEASKQLTKLSNDILTAQNDPQLHFSMTQEQQEVQDILHKLYVPAAPTASDGAVTTAPTTQPNIDELTKSERNELVQQLGWFGKLALHPPGSADQAQRAAVLAPAKALLYIVFSGVVVAGIVGFAGFIGLVVWIIFVLMGKLAHGFRDSTWHHGIYAETFAVWMIVFVVLQIGAGAVPLGSTGAEMLLTFVMFFVSLLALLWPVARGIPWSEVRRDIGWTAGRAGLAEPFVGFGGYVMTIPVLAIGVVITLGLAMMQQKYATPPELFEPNTGPAHPIIAELGSNWFVRIVVLMIGSIAAPIVEETMFRGVLYRHLRGATVGAGLAASVASSALISSFVFASIHPQGWVAIPALMSLAIMFALVREWRGSLLPSMVMHGTSNFIMMSMAIVILSF